MTFRFSAILVSIVIILLFLTIFFAPFVFFGNVFPTVGQAGLSIVYAFLIGIVGFTLYFSALKQIDATVVSILTYLEMVSGIIFAWIILGEPLTLPLIGGAVLIVVSGLVLRLGVKKNV